MPYSEPPAFTAGTDITATLLLSYLTNNFKELGDAWTTYVPVLSASTTNPTLGTGATQTGSFIEFGKLCVYDLRIVFGTGMNAGSGVYSISTPVTARAPATFRPAGNCIFTRGTTRFGYHALLIASTAIGMVDQAGNRLANNSVVWAAGDEINVSGIIQSA